MVGVGVLVGVGVTVGVDVEVGVTVGEGVPVGIQMAELQAHNLLKPAPSAKPHDWFVNKFLYQQLPSPA